MFQRICNKWLQMLTENLEKEYLTNHIAKLISKVSKLLFPKMSAVGFIRNGKAFLLPTQKFSKNLSAQKIDWWFGCNLINWKQTIKRHRISYAVLWKTIFYFIKVALYAGFLVVPSVWSTIITFAIKRAFRGSFKAFDRFYFPNAILNV